MNYSFYEDEHFISHQYEYFPSAPEAGYEYYEPYELYEPEPEPYFPSYPVMPYEEPEPEGIGLGSLWDAFKETGAALLKSPIWPALIKKDQKNIQQYYITKEADKPDPLDGRLYTPYQRGNTGSVPVPSIIQAGLSPTLLIGAGVILFLMWRKK